MLLTTHTRLIMPAYGIMSIIKSFIEAHVSASDRKESDTLVMRRREFAIMLYKTVSLAAR